MKDILKQHKVDYLWQLPPSIRKQVTKKRIVGVVSDLHIPYAAHGYLQFLTREFEKRGVTDVVIIGDMIDFNTVSRWGQDPNNKNSVLGEYEKTVREVKRVIETFPYAYYTMGNHDRRLWSIASGAGIPSKFVKTFEELFGIPETWKIGDSFIINGVKYLHGDSYGGLYGYRHAPLSNLMSTVFGHAHSNAGVSYIKTHEKMVFGMNVGSLINEKAVAFNYGKYSRFKSVISCGVVYNDQHAELIPKV